MRCVQVGTETPDLLPTVVSLTTGERRIDSRIEIAEEIGVKNEHGMDEMMRGSVSARLGSHFTGENAQTLNNTRNTIKIVKLSRNPKLDRKLLDGPMLI